MCCGQVSSDGQCMDVDGCSAPKAGTGLLMWGCNTQYPGNGASLTANDLLTQIGQLDL